MVRQALLLLIGIASLATAAWLARRPRSTGRGVLLGLLGGVLVALGGGFVIGLIGSVMPLAQLDFLIVRYAPWLF